MKNVARASPTDRSQAPTRPGGGAGYTTSFDGSHPLLGPRVVTDALRSLALPVGACRLQGLSLEQLPRLDPAEVLPRGGPEVFPRPLESPGIATDLGLSFYGIECHNNSMPPVILEAPDVIGGEAGVICRKFESQVSRRPESCWKESGIPFASWILRAATWFCCTMLIGVSRITDTCTAKRPVTSSSTRTRCSTISCVT